MMDATHGEKWLAAVHKKLAGYVKTRGWTCGPLVLISRHRDQYTIYIADRLGAAAIVAIEMDADVASFVDDYGRLTELNAATFDEVMVPHGLAPRPFVSKRQLCMVLPAPAPAIER